MNLSVKMIDDLLSYEQNVVIGMTLRQTVCSVLGVAIVAAAYLLSTYANINAQLASYLAMFLGLPCFLFGFLKPRKMPLEKFIAVWVSANLLSCRRRIYQSENLLYKIFWEQDKSPVKTDVLLMAFDTGGKHGVSGEKVTVSVMERKQRKEVFSGTTDGGGIVQAIDLLPGKYSWSIAGCKPVCFRVRKNRIPTGTFSIKLPKSNERE